MIAKSKLLAVLFAGLFLPISLWSSAEVNVSSINVAGDTISIMVSKALKKPSLKVSGPDGFYLSGKGLDLTADSILADGQYRFEIVAKVPKAAITKEKKKLNNGRDSANKPKKRPFATVYSGYFILQNGQVLEGIEE